MAASVASVLEGVFSAWAAALTADSAQQVLRFQLDADTRARVEQLADGANEGTLTESEQREYEEYVEAIDLLAILKAKARDALARRAQP